MTQTAGGNRAHRACFYFLLGVRVSVEVRVNAIRLDVVTEAEGDEAKHKTHGRDARHTALWRDGVLSRVRLRLGVRVRVRNSSRRQEFGVSQDEHEMA